VIPAALLYKMSIVMLYHCSVTFVDTVAKEIETFIIIIIIIIIVVQNVHYEQRTN